MVNSSNIDKDAQLYNEGHEKYKIKDQAELLTKIIQLEEEILTNLKNWNYS